MENFIPRQYKKEQITIRLTPQTLEKIDEAAARYDLSRNTFISQCIDFALENLPKP